MAKQIIKSINVKCNFSFNEERRTDPSVANGELDPADFGEWWPFANCLKSAMLLIEGQAYFKVDNNRLFSHALLLSNL